VRTIFITVYVVDPYRFFHQICITTDNAVAWTEQRHKSLHLTKKTLHFALTPRVSKICHCKRSETENTCIYK